MTLLLAKNHNNLYGLDEVFDEHLRASCILNNILFTFT